MVKTLTYIYCFIMHQLVLHLGSFSNGRARTLSAAKILVRVQISWVARHASVHAGSLKATSAICKELEFKAEPPFLLLHSPVTLGVKKLLRKAYGRTINIPQLPLAAWPKTIVVRQTQSNGPLIDLLITYAALMRLTPVYWLLFACFLTLLHVTSLARPLPLTVKDFKAVSGQNKYMGSLDRVTTVEKEKFPKNFWPDVSMYAWLCICVFLCVFGCVCGRREGQTWAKGDVGTNESTGAFGAVCRLWQGDETNYVQESIIISLAL